MALAALGNRWIRLWRDGMGAISIGLALAAAPAMYAHAAPKKAAKSAETHKAAAKPAVKKAAPVKKAAAKKAG